LIRIVDEAAIVGGIHDSVSIRVRTQARRFLASRQVTVMRAKTLTGPGGCLAGGDVAVKGFTEGLADSEQGSGKMGAFTNAS
jgi:hypothetical protein